MPIESARKIIMKVSKILSEIIEINQKTINKKIAVDQKNKMSIYRSIRDFLAKIFLNSNATYSIFVIAMIYIDRIVERTKLFIDKNNVFKLLSSSIGISMKLNLDYYNLSEFPSLFSSTWETIKRNEFEFLEMIDYNLFVSSEEFKIYRNSLLI